MWRHKARVEMSPKKKQNIHNGLKDSKLIDEELQPKFIS